MLRSHAQLGVSKDGQQTWCSCTPFETRSCGTQRTHRPEHVEDQFLARRGFDGDDDAAGQYAIEAVARIVLAEDDVPAGTRRRARPDATKALLRTMEGVNWTSAPEPKKPRPRKS